MIAPRHTSYNLLQLPNHLNLFSNYSTENCFTTLMKFTLSFLGMKAKPICIVFPSRYKDPFHRMKEQDMMKENLIGTSKY